MDVSERVLVPASGQNGGRRRPTIHPANVNSVPLWTDAPSHRRRRAKRKLNTKELTLFALCLTVLIYAPPLGVFLSGVLLLRHVFGSTHKGMYRKNAGVLSGAGQA